LNYASYFFEILKLESDDPAEYGELGRIVITDLFNYAFPIIRYDNGDTGILLEKDNQSNEYPILRELYGRRLDLVYNTHGCIVFMAMGRIFKNYPVIIQWQFIQNGEKEYLLKVIVNQQKQSSLTEIKNELTVLLGKDAEINIEYVNEIPVLASSKRKQVINNWKL
jgi:phenylacetate-CoA ligase